ATLKERKTGPQDDRRREHEFYPSLRADFHPAQTMSEHREEHDGYRERERPPESPAEIEKLGIFFLFRRGHFRFERHAALRTRSGPFLAHLRVHRTGVDR